MSVVMLTVTVNSLLLPATTAAAAPKHIVNRHHRRQLQSKFAEINLWLNNSTGPKAMPQQLQPRPHLTWLYVRWWLALLSYFTRPQISRQYIYYMLLQSTDDGW